MKTMIIVVFTLLILMFVIFLYCSLVVASREDDLMEKMHIQWMKDHPELQVVPKEDEHKEEKRDMPPETEVLPP